MQAGGCLADGEALEWLRQASQEFKPAEGGRSGREHHQLESKGRSHLMLRSIEGAQPQTNG